MIPRNRNKCKFPVRNRLRSPLALHVAETKSNTFYESAKTAFLAL